MSVALSPEGLVKAGLDPRATSALITSSDESRAAIISGVTPA